MTRRAPRGARWAREDHEHEDSGGGEDHYPQLVTVNIATNGTVTLDSEYASYNRDLFYSTVYDSAGGIGLQAYVGGATGAPTVTVAWDDLVVKEIP